MRCARARASARPSGNRTETPNQRLHLQCSPKCTRSVDAYQWIGGQATYCLGPSLGPRPHATRSVATGSKGRKTKVPYGAKSPWVHGCTGRLPKADTWAQDKTGREGRNTAVFRRYGGKIKVPQNARFGIIPMRVESRGFCGRGFYGARVRYCSRMN